MSARFVSQREEYRPDAFALALALATAFRLDIPGVRPSVTIVAIYPWACKLHVDGFRYSAWINYSNIIFNIHTVAVAKTIPGSRSYFCSRLLVRRKLENHFLPHVVYARRHH